jgi:hypothetical protein
MRFGDVRMDVVFGSNRITGTLDTRGRTTYVCGGLTVPLVLALATAAWVWTLPETRQRDLAQISPGSAVE